MINPLKIIWDRLDRIIGPMIISVGLGKFTGDLIGWYFKHKFGVPESLILGTLLFTLLFIFWPLIERFYDEHLKE